MSVRVLQRNRTSRLEKRVRVRMKERERDWFGLRNWLTQLQELANLQSAKQAGSLEIQVRVDVAPLSLRSAG